MKIVVTNNPTPKPIDKWSNKDLLLYFSNRLLDRFGRELVIPPIAWSAFVGRIKGFRERMGLSPEQYKRFIDDIFEFELFRGNMFAPSFGAMVSIKVFLTMNNYNAYKDRRGDIDQERWQEIADSILHNSLLFQTTEKFLDAQNKKDT